MAHRVRSDALGDTCFANRFSDLACHRVVVQMVTGEFTGAWVRAKGCGRENELPTPLFQGVGLIDKRLPGEGSSPWDGEEMRWMNSRRAGDKACLHGSDSDGGCMDPY
jgi:hypothetical protein